MSKQTDGIGTGEYIAVLLVAFAIGVTLFGYFIRAVFWAVTGTSITPVQGIIIGFVLGLMFMVGNAIRRKGGQQ